MIRILKVNFRFARMRIRREIEFDPRLKQLTKTQSSQLQIQKLRRNFRDENSETFSQAIETPKEKIKGRLGQRFYIDESKLQKNIKDSMKRSAKLSQLKELQDDGLNFLNESDSHIYDQKAEIEFEKQFRKRIFYKKQVARLIAQQEMLPRNKIKEKQDDQFVHYLENKRLLKNYKIQNMMGFNRSNQQLEMLIRAGLLEEPQNFQKVLSYMQSRDPKQRNYLPDEEKTQSQKQLTEYSQKQIAEVDPQKVKMIQQIVAKYDQMNQEDRSRYHQQVSLLHQIKEYENSIFQKRYQAINFRFKGETRFNHMKEAQLRSYIKHVNIEPKQLMQIFTQNESKISKFNLPIITPQIMSAIYTKSSFYVFPETEQNNHLNMLNDKNFKALEIKTFKNLHLLDNTSFADVVWGYSKNHRQQLGLLNPKRSHHIQNAIYEGLLQRIGSFSEEDLGLTLRALLQLPLINEVQRNWSEVIQTLGEKLPVMKEGYEIQSVLNFLSLIPVSYSSIRIVKKNIHLMLRYQWEFEQSLTTFLRLSSFLVNHHKSIELKIMKGIIGNLIQQKYKSGDLVRLIPKYSVNSIAYFVSVLLKCEVSITQLNNLCKKYAIEAIKGQKQLLNQSTLPTLALSFSYLDFWEAHGVVPSSLKTIVPGRVHVFNSAKYFVYHDIARLTASEVNYLNSKALSDILRACSLTQYKNEGFYDSVVESLLKKIDKKEEDLKSIDLIKIYMTIIQSFSLQKRSNNLYQQIRDNLFAEIEKSFGREMNMIKPNTLVNFVVSFASIEGQKMTGQQLNICREIVLKNILPFLKYLPKQELVSLLFMSVIHLKLQVKQQILKTMVKYLKLSVFTLEELFTISLVTSEKEFDEVNLTQNIQYRYDNVEKLYFEKRLDAMLSHQQHVGTEYPYTQVFARFADKIKRKYDGKQIIELPWRIEVPSEKTVFFFATYDHIMMHQETEAESQKEKKMVLRLFGVWRAFSILYQSKGWEFIPVYTFLQAQNTMTSNVSVSRSNDI